MEPVRKRLQAFFCSTLFALFAYANPAMASLVTFDFEEFAPQITTGALVSNGFVLDPGNVDWAPGAEGWIGHYHIVDPTFGGLPNNGTQYFLFDYFLDNSVLNIYAVSGGVFGIKQFDMAEDAIFSACPSWRTSMGEVTFTGYLAEGGTISQRDTFDMICDGAGPLDDFQTFTFDGRWNRLTAFSIVPDYPYANPSLDNLVLRTVPEPKTYALMLTGLGLLGWVGRRKKLKEGWQRKARSLNR